MYKWKYKVLYSEEATYPKQSKRNGLKDTTLKLNSLVNPNPIQLKLKYVIDNNRLINMITLHLKELLMELLLLLDILELLRIYV